MYIAVKEYQNHHLSDVQFSQELEISFESHDRKKNEKYIQNYKSEILNQKSNNFSKDKNNSNNQYSQYQTQLGKLIINVPNNEQDLQKCFHVIQYYVDQFPEVKFDLLVKLQEFKEISIYQLLASWFLENIIIYEHIQSINLTLFIHLTQAAFQIKMKEWRLKIQSIRFIRGANCEAINQKSLDVIKRYLLNLKYLNELEFTFGNLYDKIYYEQILNQEKSILTQNMIQNNNNNQINNSNNAQNNINKSNTDLDENLNQSSSTTFRGNEDNQGHLPLNKHQYFKESFEVCLKIKTPADKEFFLLFLKLFLSAKSSIIKQENDQCMQYLKEKSQTILMDNQFKGKFVEVLKTDFFVLPISFVKFTDLKVLHFQILEEQFQNDIIQQTVQAFDSLELLENLAINIKEEKKGLRNDLFRPLIQKVCQISSLKVFVIKWKYRRFTNLCENQKNMVNLIKIHEIHDGIYNEDLLNEIQLNQNFIELNQREQDYDPFNSKKILFFPKLTKYRIKSTKSTEQQIKVHNFQKINYYERISKESLRYRQKIMYFLSYAQKYLKQNNLFKDQQGQQTINDLVFSTLFAPKLSNPVHKNNHDCVLKHINEHYSLEQSHFESAGIENYFDDQISISSSSSSVENNY